MCSSNLQHFLRTRDCVNAESGNRGARQFRVVNSDCLPALRARSAECPHRFIAHVVRLLPTLSTRSHAEEELDLAVNEGSLAIHVEVPLVIAAPVKKLDKHVEIFVAILALLFGGIVAAKGLQRAPVTCLSLRDRLPQPRIRTRCD